jgi:DNA-binding transcriptional MerR regulator
LPEVGRSLRRISDVLTSEYLLRSIVVKHPWWRCCIVLGPFFAYLEVPVSDWRIDELAQRAGVAVDTIRYYQREGVLPAGARNGRTLRYGPEHLERLERIRAFQARRFSLAAIRALLDHDEPGGLAGLLGSEADTYDLDELVEAADVDEQFVCTLIDAGVLRDPAEHGRSAYDAEDLRALRSFADLNRLAVPADALVDVARIYSEEFERVHHRLVELFTTIATESWDADDIERFRTLFSEEMERFGRDVRVIADYAHQRNIQRRVLSKIEMSGCAAPTPNAGVPPAATG